MGRRAQPLARGGRAPAADAERAALARVRAEHRRAWATLYAPTLLGIAAVIGAFAFILIRAPDGNPGLGGMLGGFVFFFGLQAAAHVRSRRRELRGILVPSHELARRAALRSAGGAAAYDPTIVVHEFALANASLGVTVPAADLPGLEELLQRAAAAVGETVPAECLVVPEAWPVAGNDEVWLIGVIALLAMPADEFSAAIARHAALAGDRTPRLIARARTTGLTACNPEYGALLEGWNAPCHRAGVRLETAIAVYIQTRRELAAAAAEAFAGPGTVAAAASRELCATSVWEAHLDTAQAEWASVGRAVRPLETLRARLAALPAGAELPVDGSALRDELSVWGVERQSTPSAIWPASSAPPVLDALGEAGHAALLALDDALASAYFEERVGDEFGAPGLGAGGGGAADAAAADRLIRVDPSDTYPVAALVERQVAALDDLTVRRHPDSIRIARLIAGAPVSANAELSAWAVVWRAGDDAALAQLEAALGRAPWSAPILAPQVPALRRAGAASLADRVEALVEQLAHWLEAPLLHAPVGPPTHAPLLRAAVAEMCRAAPSPWPMWIVNAPISPDASVPVVVIDPGRNAAQADPIRAHLREWLPILQYLEPLTRPAFPQELGASAVPSIITAGVVVPRGEALAS